MIINGTLLKFAFAAGLAIACLSVTAPATAILATSSLDDAQSLSPGAYPPPEVDEDQLTLVHAKPNIANHNELTSFIDGVVRAHMRADHIPGVVVAIVRDDISILEKGYGQAGNGKAVGADKTLFRLGEISGIFTWTALMQIEESGYISLDDPVNNRLPESLSMPVHATGPLLIRHLMDYKSGLDIIEPDRIAHLSAESLPSPENALAKLRPKQVRPAGLYTVPSVYATTLAGAVLTQVTGRNFSSYMEDNIFTPMGMTSSSFREPMSADLAEVRGLPQPLPKALVESLAMGYRSENATLTEQPYIYYSTVAPALSLSSTAHDMARFMRGVLNFGQLDEARILRPETIKRMHSPLSDTADLRLPTIRHGLLDYILPGGIRGIGQTGSIPGFTSNLVMIPGHDLGIFVATNSDEGKALVDALPALLVAHFFPEEMTGQTPTSDPRQMPMDVSVEGIYFDLDRPINSRNAIFDALGTRYRVRHEKNGTLRVTGPHNSMRYIMIEPGLYSEVEGEKTGASRIRFIKEKDGSVTHMTSPSGQTTMEKTGFYSRPLWLFIMAIAVGLASLILLAGTWHRRHLPSSDNLTGKLTGILTPVLALVWLTSCSLLLVLFVSHLTLSAPITATWTSALAIINLLAVALTGIMAIGLLVIWQADSPWTLGHKSTHTAAIVLMLWLLFPLFHWNLVGF